MKLPKKIAALLTVTLVASSAGNLSFADTVQGASSEQLTGAGRWETAIEISKKGWETSDTAIIVNDNSIADALAATPFADANSAPILLTGKDNLNETTKAELERLQAKKVYLIGGEAVLSKNIETELENLNIEIDRIQGETRELTALEIAKRLDEIKPISEIAVVNGYTGLADAVSIAATAAKEDMAIILSNPVNGTQDSDEFINSGKIETSYVIGGENAISNEVVSNLQTTNVERIEGIDRNETNAKVIETFYTEKDIKNAYVAKDGMTNEGQLIDALSVGVLAAKNDSPVIIVGNKLNEMQIDVTNTKSFKTVTQVGGNGNEAAFNELKTLQGVNTYEVTSVEELNEALAKADANDIINVRSLNGVSRNSKIEITTKNTVRINLYDEVEASVVADVVNGTVVVYGDHDSIDMKNGELVIEGNINTITVNGQDAKISVGKDSTVTKVEVSENASGTAIENAGKIDSVVSNAPNVSVKNSGTVGSVSGSNAPSIDNTEGGSLGVSSISITTDTMASAIKIGSTIQLNVVVSPSNATNKKVTWTSSDKNIASVDDNGIVTGVSAGKVTITATANNGIEGSYQLYVGESIQDMIDNVDDGATILLNNGTYTENLIVDKSITVIGESKENTIVNGSFYVKENAIDTTNTNLTFALENCTVKAIEKGSSALNLNEDLTVKLITKNTDLLGAEGGNGIKIPATSTLDLSGSELLVEGNNGMETKDTIGGSGIGNAGKNVGKIYIHDMENLIARGYGKHACGIGGVMAGEIIIENSTINEVKGGIPQESFTTSYGKGDPEGGVAIGVMLGSECDKVTLENVTVNKAIGGSKSAAIGAGYWATIDLAIKNSTLTNVQGGNSSAGIGGSRIAQNSTGDLWKINIDNSTIQAKGGQHGAGIGSGYDTYCTTGSEAAKCIINITGNSIIEAVGGQYAAGIGTGYHAGGLRYEIDSTVKTEGTHSSEPVRKDGYTVAQAIGYGVLDPKRSGLGVVYETVSADEFFETAGTATSGKYEVNGEVVVKSGHKFASNANVTYKGGTFDFTEKAQVNANNSNITFENSKIKCANNQVYTGITHANQLTYVNCEIEGQFFAYSQNTKFVNCTFKTKDLTNYNIWTYGSNVTFENCKFESAGKSVLVYNEGGDTKVDLKDCTFATSLDMGKAAIEISGQFSKPTVTIENCTQTGFKKKGLWFVKDKTKEPIVIVDGEVQNY